MGYSLIILTALRKQIGCSALFLLLVSMVLPAGAGTIDSSLRAKRASLGPGDEIPVIIKLSYKADLEKIKDREQGVRKTKIIRALRETANVSQQRLQAFLTKNKTKKHRSLWLINGIAATVPVALVDELAAFPGVEAVTLDALIHSPVTTYGTAAAPAWNITAIHAEELWNMGYTGAGIVVANMDSGVDGDQPDLQGKWRGGTNSWFDPNGEHPLPADVDGHGTATMGIMVGGDAGGTFIGVAPGAQWIAVKIFNDAGDASYSAIHAGFQWLLDPDGNPDTDDAPHVVNNSWGLDDPAHGCNTEFQTDVQTLKTAGIALVFSAGNDGPGTSTSMSPGNYPEAFSVGAIDSTNTIASFSSRGPSACGGDIYPKVVAPGVDILTTDLFLGLPGAYVFATGTSFASPHVAGAMALLWSAFPALEVSSLETALTNSATDLGVAGADNDYGNGLLNALGAYRFLKMDKLAVYQDGLWYADSNGNGQWDGEAVDGIHTFGVGLSGALPLSGDWNGNGTTRIGVYDEGTWYLDLNGNGVWDGTPADAVYAFGTGLTGSVPVTGDWTGTGTTQIGVFHNGIWYLDLNGNGSWDDVPADGRYTFGVGLSGAAPVTGDWTGNGTTQIGVFHYGTWYLDLNGNSSWDGTPADATHVFGVGLTGAFPAPGDWTGTGSSQLGVFAEGKWYLDMNGNGAWDSADMLYYFGTPGAGEKPVTGTW